MSFVHRLVNASFDLGQGTFSAGGSNLTVMGARISAHISKAGSVQETMILTVWGLSLDEMNELATLGMQINLVQRNFVTVTAGDEGGEMSQVFYGVVTNCWVDMSTPGDACMRCEATAAGSFAVQKTPAISYEGSSDVVTMMKDLAGKAGLNFENNGVSAKLADQYLHGSIYDQIEQVRQGANIMAFIDNKTLVIAPINKARNGDAVLISKETGMIGYPSYTSQFLIVRTLFNPAIKFWGKVQIKSDIKLNNETWAVLGIDLALESNLPQGDWMSVLQCFNPNYAGPVLS